MKNTLGTEEYDLNYVQRAIMAGCKLDNFANFLANLSVEKCNAKYILLTEMKKLGRFSREVTESLYFTELIKALQDAIAIKDKTKSEESTILSGRVFASVEA